MDRFDSLCALLCRSRLEADALEPIFRWLEDVHLCHRAYIAAAVHGVLAMDVFAREENRLAREALVYSSRA